MIVARFTTDVRSRIPRPTPRVPMSPTRNGFWIFMGPLAKRSTVAVGGDTFRLLQHTTQVLEVSGDSLALDPNLRPPFFCVGHQALRALFGLFDQRRRTLLC